MVLKDIYNILRPHQRAAVDALDSGVKRGQILLPTGVGKTYVQVYKILSTLHSLQHKGVAVIAAHRLLLCEQLIKDVARYALETGLPFNILTVASDGMDMQDMAMLADDLNTDGNLMSRCLVDRATSSQEILDCAAKAKALGRHLLVVSTYQSFDRMAGLCVDVACLDEAHTITEEDKHEKVNVMQPHMAQAFFFTATQVTGCNGRGMNNTGFYGQKLYEVSPRAAIDSRDILPPAIHNIRLEGGRPSYAQVIKAAYKAHREKVLEQSKGLAAPKLLVSVAGVEDMVDLLKDPHFHMWAMESGVNTVGFSSSMGYYKNGLETTRKEALQALRDLGDMDSAIIMHYDILTEGIDLPNITAVMPLRELCKVKFLQTLGRAARLQKDDRQAIYSGAKPGTGIDPETNRVVVDATLVKPLYWVIQNPMLNDQALETNQSLVEIIRSEYQVEPEERNQPQTSTTSSLEDADSVLEPPAQTPQERKLANLTHEFEALLYLAMMPAALPANPTEQEKKAYDQGVEAAKDFVLASLQWMETHQPTVSTTPATTAEEVAHVEEQAASDQDQADTPCSPPAPTVPQAGVRSPATEAYRRNRAVLDRYR